MILLCQHQQRQEQHRRNALPPDKIVHQFQNSFEKQFQNSLKKEQFQMNSFNDSSFNHVEEKLLNGIA